MLNLIIEEIKYYLTLNFTMHFYKDTKEKYIKNDFAPNLINEYFSINNIISCLQHGFMRMSKLPPEIADVVQEELNKIKESKLR